MEAGKHVLCEKPLTLTRKEAEEMFTVAAENRVVLLEAIKTAFSPGFQRMVAVARSGSIGQVRSVDGTFTKLGETGREMQAPDGGSISELASYPLLAVVKLLGTAFVDQRTVSLWPEGSEVETFSRIDITYPHAVASARVGLGVKADGLRYEIAEFASLIRNETPESFKLRAAESIAIAAIIEEARNSAVMVR
jgi:choline-phosphate cytidylyltransferase